MFLQPQPDAFLRLEQCRSLVEGDGDLSVRGPDETMGPQDVHDGDLHFEQRKSISDAHARPRTKWHVQNGLALGFLLGTEPRKQYAHR